MRRTTLGRSGIEVSAFCLGSMTWGSQNSADEGHAQIDMALDGGVDFIDTAEMYPMMPSVGERLGRTEEIIGEWVARSGRRAQVVIATKVSGKNGGFVREGRGIDGAVIRDAVEASLRRLRTDVIDLYQLHWPNRGGYMFRQHWSYDPSGQDRAETLAHMDDVLRAMQDMVAQGKVRAFGLSNESCWGTVNWLRAAEAEGLPRVASVQNEYSLLCRLYDTDMAEMGVNEDVTLLAFSPLAAGFLTGKYAPDVTPPGSRRSLNDTMGGRLTPRIWGAIDAHADIARRQGLDLSQMALAWCLTRPFPCIPIFGATSRAQLETTLGAADLELAPEVLEAITQAHRAHPMSF